MKRIFSLLVFAFLLLGCTTEQSSGPIATPLVTPTPSPTPTPEPSLLQAAASNEVILQAQKSVPSSTGFLSELAGVQVSAPSKYYLTTQGSFGLSLSLQPLREIDFAGADFMEALKRAAAASHYIKTISVSDDSFELSWTTQDSNSKPQDIVEAKLYRDKSSSICVKRAAGSVTAYPVSAITFQEESASGILPDFSAIGNTLVSYGNHVAEINKNNEIIWDYNTIGLNPLDDDFFSGNGYVERLTNGNTLVTSTSYDTVFEVSPDKKIVWRYGKPNISSTGGVSVKYAPTFAQKLSNGNVLITQSKGQRVIEVDAKGNIVWQYGTTGESGYGNGMLNEPKSARRLDNGNTLIVDRLGSRVIEVSVNKDIVWQYGSSNGGGGNGPNTLINPGYAKRLLNGNTLIGDDYFIGSDSTGSHFKLELLEVNPNNEIVRRSIFNNSLNNSGFNYNSYSSFQVLDNGNYLVADLSRTVMEASPQDTLSWSYKTPAGGLGYAFRIEKETLIPSPIPSISPFVTASPDASVKPTEKPSLTPTPMPSGYDCIQPTPEQVKKLWTALRGNQLEDAIALFVPDENLKSLLKVEKKGVLSFAGRPCNEYGLSLTDEAVRKLNDMGGTSITDLTGNVCLDAQYGFPLDANLKSSLASFNERVVLFGAGLARVGSIPVRATSEDAKSESAMRKCVTPFYLDDYRIALKPKSVRSNEYAEGLGCYARRRFPDENTQVFAIGDATAKFTLPAGSRNAKVYLSKAGPSMCNSVSMNGNTVFDSTNRTYDGFRYCQLDANKFIDLSASCPFNNGEDVLKTVSLSGLDADFRITYKSFASGYLQDQQDMGKRLSIKPDQYIYGNRLSGEFYYEAPRCANRFASPSSTIGTLYDKISGTGSLMKDFQFPTKDSNGKSLCKPMGRVSLKPGECVTGGDGKATYQLLGVDFDLNPYGPHVLTFRSECQYADCTPRDYDFPISGSAEKDWFDVQGAGFKQIHVLSVTSGSAIGDGSIDAEFFAAAVNTPSPS